MQPLRLAMLRIVPPLLFALLLAGCGANRPTTMPLPLTATPQPTAAAMPAVPPTTPPTPAPTPTRLPRTRSTEPISFPCATPTPNPACETLRATLVAKPTAPPLSDFTMTLIVEDEGDVLAVRPALLRARISGPDNPYCNGEAWDFGDGKPQPRSQPACAAYEPPIATPSATVITEHAKAYGYGSPGTYRVQFCLSGGRDTLCATTTIRAG